MLLKGYSMKDVSSVILHQTFRVEILLAYLDNLGQWNGQCQ